MRGRDELSTYHHLLVKRDGRGSERSLIAVVRPMDRSLYKTEWWTTDEDTGRENTQIKCWVEGQILSLKCVYVRCLLVFPSPKCLCLGSVHPLIFLRVVSKEILFWFYFDSGPGFSMEVIRVRTEKRERSYGFFTGQLDRPFK